MTNYERIINRSIYEMASELEKISNYVCDYYDSCDECPFNFFRQTRLQYNRIDRLAQQRGRKMNLIFAQILHDTKLINRFLKCHDDSILTDNGWISVNDKLPNNDEDVIALSDSGDSLVCRYNNDMKRWEKYGFTLDMNFIYWRELYKCRKDKVND